MLNTEIKKYIDRSVLCWLATASSDNMPNVSPKEVFTYYGDSSIIIANIASPQTVKNIKENQKVCVSFIDILVQKGFQIKGTAELILKSHSQFEEMAAPLLAITKGKFPFASISCIKIEKVKPILAPSYLLYPDTIEEDQIKSALQTYGFKKGDK